VNAIVVHHTHTEYTDSFEGIKQIYKYHALSKSWGDIGYNYIIGYDGEIFEGRQGGDYTVAAHSVWNNISTV
jgi:N-acetylmuramoyl-L-alanine amidase